MTDRLRQALKPFVLGSKQVLAALESGEKMHPANVDFYRHDVARAKKLLEGDRIE
jgi:hypothetical protein